MILKIPANQIVPERASVLEALGVPREREVSERIEALYASAVAVFKESAAPVAIVAEITAHVFARVFAGEGMNAPDSVVADILPRAEQLALFAVTLGAETQHAIARGFSSHDYAQATLLDAMASEAADRAAEVVERVVEQAWMDEERLADGGAALRYSPGYCGWHVTGQRSLFQYLGPEQIGITLTDSFLMQPLKSVSGVIMAGPGSIHRISPTYSFCAQCRTHACRERMRTLFSRRRRSKADLREVEEAPGSIESIEATRSKDPHRGPPGDGQGSHRGQ